jgi:hypothetical protein
VPVDLDPNVRFYNVTSGGTAGVEGLNINGPAVEDTGVNAAYVGQRMVVYFLSRTDNADRVHMSHNTFEYFAVYANSNNANIGPQAVNPIVLTNEGDFATFVFTGYYWYFDYFNSNVPFTTVENDVNLQGDFGGNVNITGGYTGSTAGGDVIIQGGSGTSVGLVKMPALPTADPHVLNALYLSAGALMVSAG